MLAEHQGPYRTVMTIRQRFFIHNLMNKVKRYYASMQDLSIDIKHITTAFGGYQYLLVITCNLTNFTIVTPLRSRDVQSVAKALIYRVIYLFRPPRQIICNEAAEFTSHIVQAILTCLIAN